MIDVKQAVYTADEALHNLYAGTDLEDVLLEEVQLSDDERYWLVTMGFTRPPGRGDLDPLIHRPRLYKSIKIDAETGASAGMSIRGLNTSQ